MRLFIFNAICLFLGNDTIANLCNQNAHRKTMWRAIQTISSCVFPLAIIGAALLLIPQLERSVLIHPFLASFLLLVVGEIGIEVLIVSKGYLKGAVLIVDLKSLLWTMSSKK